MELLIVLMSAAFLIGTGAVWAWRLLMFVLLTSNLHSGLCREQTKAPRITQRSDRRGEAMARTLQWRPGRIGYKTSEVRRG